MRLQGTLVWDPLLRLVGALEGSAHTPTGSWEQTVLLYGGWDLTKAETGSFLSRSSLYQIVQNHFLSSLLRLFTMPCAASTPWPGLTTVHGQHARFLGRKQSGWLVLLLPLIHLERDVPILQILKIYKVWRKLPRDALILISRTQVWAIFI